MTRDELRSRYLGHHALRRFAREMGVSIDLLRDEGDIGCRVGHAVSRVTAADRDRAWEVAEEILQEFDARDDDEVLDDLTQLETAWGWLLRGLPRFVITCAAMKYLLGERVALWLLLGPLALGLGGLCVGQVISVFETDPDRGWGLRIGSALIASLLFAGFGIVWCIAAAHGLVPSPGQVAGRQ